MDRAHHLGQPVVDVLLPPSGKGPGVLVAHPWWGLNRTIRDYGEALAREGFVVGLPDLFAGETTTSIETAETLIRKHWDAAGDRLDAAFVELGSHAAVTGARLGAVGFSFGGFHLLAQLGPKAWRGPLVTYYATYPGTFEDTTMLAHFAEHDVHESDADRDAMIAAIAPNVAHIYPGTRHWFAEADRPEHDAAAAKLAFERTVAFLKAHL